MTVFVARGILQPLPEFSLTDREMFLTDISAKTWQWISDDTVCTNATRAAELIPGTKLEHFPNAGKKIWPDQSQSQQLLITAEDAAYRTQWNVKYSYSSCPMKQMDFLCDCCDTILQLCHYISNKALVYDNGCHGHTGKSSKCPVFGETKSLIVISRHILYTPLSHALCTKLLDHFYTTCTSSNHSVLFSEIPPVYLQACAVD